MLSLNSDAPDTQEIAGINLPTISLNTHDDASGLLARRYLGDASAAIYLIRPDQHVVARWPGYDAKKLRAALCRALGKDI